ncbi:hypothetical protein [Aeromicrobium duanguangcaii]|uniref:Uncharacterized protein n=1 Tax=Aeromicrobium duanguangcaii TaxID=2968086 RepID=A0ABY5KE69_9ACTN|nr:hypothetical protein [Aeromicrobium duanguangcaii]MCD9154165.1 hypothetical protein [Aeromicrobium duanguangcaii]UUI68764.1 hypothetical protein NP095_01240 [Aeromicrobium duanguangcaii]
MAGGPELRAELEGCRRELAAAREAHESCAERAAAADRAEAQALEISRTLDAQLTRSERVASGPKGWLKRRVLPNAATPQELADAQELRASSLFDGAWYLRAYPDVVSTGLSPALHYLRHGAAEGKDPGPEFSTKRYLAKHPLVAQRRANPLLNHLRTHQ